MLMSNNLPLLVGKSQEQDSAISTILSRGDDTLKNLTENLILLTRFVKVKVFFDKEITVRLNNRIGNIGKNLSELVVGKFFIGERSGALAYSTRHNYVRSGYVFPWLANIRSYEPVVGKQPSNMAFSSLKAFQKRFDPRFISEDLIAELYNSKSAQTGERYTPKDFKPVGPKGKEVVKYFLSMFKSINEETSFYHDRRIGDETIKEVRAYKGQSYRSGRDITVSHTLGQDKVFFSSEFSGCLNGQYGLLATENTYLHLEND